MSFFLLPSMSVHTELSSDLHLVAITKLVLHDEGSGAECDDEEDREGKVPLHVERGLDGTDGVFDGSTTGLEVGATDLYILLRPCGIPETISRSSIFTVKDGVSVGLPSSQANGELTSFLAEDFSNFVVDLLDWLDIGVFDSLLTVLDKVGHIGELGVGHDFSVVSVNHEGVGVGSGVDISERLHEVGDVHIDTDDTLEDTVCCRRDRSRSSYHENLSVVTKVWRGELDRVLGGGRESILGSDVPGSLSAIVGIGTAGASNSTSGEHEEETGLGSPELPTGSFIILGVLVASIIELLAGDRVTAGGSASKNIWHVSGSVGILVSERARASSAGGARVGDSTVGSVENLGERVLVAAQRPVGKVGGTGSQCGAVEIVHSCHTGGESLSHLGEDRLEQGECVGLAYRRRGREKREL